MKEEKKDQKLSKGRGTDKVLRLDNILKLQYGFNILLDLYKDAGWNNNLSIAKDNKGELITLANYVVDLRSNILKNDRNGIFIFDMNLNQESDNISEILQKLVSPVSIKNELNIQNFKVALLGQARLKENGHIYFSQQEKILIGENIRTPIVKLN